MYHDGIPHTDILGNKLNVGDKVDVFNSRFISYENCTIVERDFYQNENEIVVKRAVKVNKNMWIFGLGNHEIIKIV